MKTIYVADDGKKFDSVEECKAHESKVNDKEKRWKEVEKAYTQFTSTLNKYCNDYPEDDIDTRWFPF